MKSSLSSLKESTALFATIQFDRQLPLSRAVLSSERQFEQDYIRDAEPHELALFEAPAETALNDEDTAMKRVGPQAVTVTRDKATLLKDKKEADPRRCLAAAQKLLDLYTLPRAAEHVQALLQQLDGLIRSLQASEQALAKPVAKPAEAQLATTRVAELQDAIKREQMEVFAIEQMNEELKKKRTEAAAKATMKPTTTGGRPPAKKSLKETIAEKRAAARAASAAVSSSPSSPARAPAVRSPVRSSAPAASPAKPPPAVKAALASPGKSASPIKSPNKTPTKATTPTKPTKVATPTSAKTTPKKPARDGLSDAELSTVTDKLWANIGQVLKPWARKTLKLAGEAVPSPLESLPFQQTRATLNTALTTQPHEPTSPGSLASTALTNEEEDDPPAPAPQQILEFELLRLLLDCMSGNAPAGQPSPAGAALPTTATPQNGQLPTLTITYRDALSSATKEPMVSMAALKAHLLKAARERQCSEDLATKAIYALVSKNVLRIDRRGTAAVGFRA